MKNKERPFKEREILREKGMNKPKKRGSTFELERMREKNRKKERITKRKEREKKRKQRKNNQQWPLLFFTAVWSHRHSSTNTTANDSTTTARSAPLLLHFLLLLWLYCLHATWTVENELIYSSLGRTTLAHTNMVVPGLTQYKKIYWASIGPTLFGPASAQHFRTNSAHFTFGSNSAQTGWAQPHWFGWPNSIYYNNNNNI